MTAPKPTITARALAHVQDEISYVIECFLQGDAVEALNEVVALIDNLKEFNGFDEPYRNDLCFSLQEVLRDVQAGDPAAARTKLIILRRLLYNAWLSEVGLEEKYLFDAL